MKLNVVRGPDGPIMTQCTLLEVRGWGLRLHFFHRGDPEGFHDHPRSYASIGILGSYLEEMRDGSSRIVSPGTITVRRATHEHRVTPLRTPCVTFAIVTPRVRQWQKRP